ncbi:MAG: hypothetical protein M3R70_11840 [Actinomycetota bacterium]|nr:hypothetical protein [Actinomycetota bacterium]
MQALRLLARLDVTYAEACRALIPVASRRGLTRPSYFTVRRFLAAERLRRKRAADLRDEIVADVLAGLVLRPLWRATQEFGTGARRG